MSEIVNKESGTSTEQNNRDFERIIEIYKIAINARTITYDNLYKWMTYYYVAVGAIFLGFYTVKSDDPLRNILIILGYVISILWYLSSKGYYFWILNWIDVIKLIENKLPIESRIYWIFSDRIDKNYNSFWNPTKPANISTAKITIFFSFCVSIIWAYSQTLLGPG